MKSGQQSIYDLASGLGVSASTVSRVLNGRVGIGAATRKKVLESARAAGFRPRASARQLTLAVVIDRNQFVTYGGFVSSLISHVVRLLAQHDVAVELVTERNFNRLRDRLVDGILAMTWDDSSIAELKRFPDVPVVTINRMDVDAFSAVATDHRKQGEIAANYFAGRGHRRVAMICEERENWGSLQRIDGFVGAMRDLGLEVPNDCVISTDHQPMYGVLRRLIAICSPTAIYIAGEDMTLEVTHILGEVLGLSIPKDVSVIGMESPKISQFLSPPMTTIAQPLEELARESLKVLLNRIDAVDQTPERVMLDSRLIERESVSSASSFS